MWSTCFKILLPNIAFAGLTPVVWGTEQCRCYKDRATMRFTGFRSSRARAFFSSPTYCFAFPLVAGGKGLNLWQTPLFLKNVLISADTKEIMLSDSALWRISKVVNNERNTSITTADMEWCTFCTCSHFVKASTITKNVWLSTVPATSIMVFMAETTMEWGLCWAIFCACWHDSHKPTVHSMSLSIPHHN